MSRFRHCPYRGDTSRYAAAVPMKAQVEALKVGLQEIVAMTGESLPVIHDAINAGHLATFLVGRRRFARPDAVRKWVDYLEQQSNKGLPVKYRARSLERRPS